MTLKLRCEDYGFECEYILDEEKTLGMIEKFRNHLEEEHGIDYTTEASYSNDHKSWTFLESIKK